MAQSSPLLSDRLRRALFAIELVGGLTLIRSIAFDRWITVLASVLLLVGAAATARHRTWGVALALAAAAAFPVAWAVGIAPFWFCIVGVVGALPFGILARDFVRFDARATALLTALATSLGAAGAILWKQYALAAFTAFPSIQPSLHAHHGLTIAALLGAAMVARSHRRDADADAASTVTIPAYSERRVRISDEAGARELHEADDRLHEEAESSDVPRRLASR